MSDSSVPLCAPGQDCAILFARTPGIGRVKSRLRTHLTADQSCRLHCASTNDTMELLDRELGGIPKWLFLSERPSAGIESTGLRLPSGFGGAWQEGHDLGQRMGAAFRRAFRSGARRVVLFGSDSPTLPSAIVSEAFRRLAACDLVLGPAEDGGYYLIGCTRFDPELFQSVEWSTPRALERTLANAERLGYRPATLQTWYDLDVWSDVERMLADSRRGLRLPRHVVQFMKEWDLQSGVSDVREERC